MKFQVGSDWHLEFHADGGKHFLYSVKPEAEVLVLAGDIAARPMLPWVFRNLCARFKHVLYVPGNHEFYGQEPRDMWDELKSYETQHSNLQVLRNTATTVEGQRFLAGTMWFPAGYKRSAIELMNDFDCIKGFVPWVHYEHETFLRLMEMATPEDVVISHHIPTELSSHKRFATSSVNHFFIAPVLDHMPLRKKPKVWVHGHTHDAYDYHLQNTRVVCNPLGYPHEGHALRAYKETLVVET